MQHASSTIRAVSLLPPPSRGQARIPLVLLAVGAMALSTPALGQVQDAYKFKVDNGTALAVTATCVVGSGEVNVEKDEVSGVITCNSDGLQVVQSETNITATYSRADDYNYGSSAGDNCEPGDILRINLGGTTTWAGDRVLTQFPYASIHALIGCEEDV